MQMTASSPNDRKRGAQPGNINAVKSGRWATQMWGGALQKGEAILFETALQIPDDDLHDVIALIRVRLHALLDGKPDAFEALFKGMVALAYLCRTQYNLTGAQTDSLIVGMGTILAEFRLTADSIASLPPSAFAEKEARS